MIKYFILSFCCWIFLGETFGQANNNYIWLLGYPPNQPEEFNGGTLLDFNENEVSPKFVNIYSALSEPAILSSDKGRLKAYSNGCNLYNSMNELMLDGDSLGFGYIWEGHCEFGYPGTQDKLLLPWPGDTTKAILFHMMIDDDFVTNYLLYSIIDFSQEAPAGIVVRKNQYLLDAKLSGNITACKHANGRDWWIILPEGKSNGFFIMVLNPEGVTIVDTINIGQSWGNSNWGGQAVFTPDGRKYIRYNPWKGLDIFDFDRTTGKISNIRESGPFSDPVNIGGGVASSLDSKYLYVSENINLFQFDLQADNILYSKTLIDTFDGYANPFPTTFYQMLLAPDGKIYMSSTNGVKSLHVINHPEKSGSECEFIQHGMELPAFNFIGSINMPYFRLGPIDGGVADTLGIDNSPIADFRYEIDETNPLEVHFRNLSYFSPETYYWSFGNTTSSYLENPFPVKYNSYGKYEICLTVANQFGNNTFCRNVLLGDSISSTNLVIDTSGIKIFPNPFSSHLTINFGKDFGRISMQLYSITGKQIFNEEFQSEESKIIRPFLAAGIYLYTITSNGIVIKSGKVIKIE